MINQDEVIKLRNEIEDRADELLKNAGVVGAGVSIIGEEGERRLGIKVYLDRNAKKRVGDAVLSRHFDGLDFATEPVTRPVVKPKTRDEQPITYNDGRGSVPSDIGNSRELVQPRVYDGRYDPLTGGSRIQAERDFLGTLGGTVYDSLGNAFGLTNWHVADTGDGNPIGNAIHQPNLALGNANLIGACTDAALGRTSTGWIDAAIVRLNGSRLVSQRMNGIGGNATTSTVVARLGMRVVKSGRTTEVTSARIDSVGYVTSIDYGPPAGVVQFRRQILMGPDPTAPAPGEEISMGGDSGSLWLERDTNKAVALHFAGETSNDPREYAVGNPMQAVLTRFNLRFETAYRPIYRWWHPGFRDHFYCIDPGGEIAPDVGYVFEGAPWGLFMPGEPNAVPFHRWWHPTARDHFYTADPSGELAPSIGYRYEGNIGLIGRSPKTGAVPLFRWYQPQSQDHFYTTDPNGEIAPTSGYSPEGIAGYVLPL